MCFEKTGWCEGYGTGIALDKNLLAFGEGRLVILKINEFTNSATAVAAATFYNLGCLERTNQRKFS